MLHDVRRSAWGGSAFVYNSSQKLSYRSASTELTQIGEVYVSTANPCPGHVWTHRVPVRTGDCNTTPPGSLTGAVL